MIDSGVEISSTKEPPQHSWGSLKSFANNSWCSWPTTNQTNQVIFSLWVKLEHESIVNFETFCPFSTQPHQNWPNFCHIAKLLGWFVWVILHQLLLAGHVSLLRHTLSMLHLLNMFNKLLCCCKKEISFG